MATQKYFANFVLLYTEDIEHLNHPQMTKSYTLTFCYFQTKVEY